MTKKVLLWLDDSVSYLHFGIGLSLKKIHDYKFYGLTSFKKDYDFFSNQDLINFEELHYYPEHYESNTSFDIDFLKKIETKLDRNLWQMIYSERFFIEDRSFFHYYTKNEIFSIIEPIIKFYLDFLNRVQPDFIIMQQVGENISNILLFYVAKSLGIKTLMLSPLKLFNSFLLSDDYKLNEIKSEYFKSLNSTSSFSSVDIDYIKKRTHFSHVKTGMNAKFVKFSLSKKITRYIQQFNKNPPLTYHNRHKNFSNYLPWLIKTKISQNKISKFLEKNSLREVIEKDNFVFFPLNQTPEAVNLFNSPYHSNLLSLIQYISKSLPVDSILYVKEHPAQKIKLWKSLTFYQDILKLPNVKLIHNETSHFELISKCKAVIGVFPTAGFEALFFNKPVLTLHDIFYDGLNSVFPVNDISELPDLFTKAFQLKIDNSKELSCLINVIENNEIVIPYMNMMSDTLKIKSSLYNDSLNDSLDNFQNFYEHYQTEFDLIANHYHNFKI
jgi:hypothetical protein